MIDDELKLLHELLLKLGVTLTLAALLFGVYYYMSRKRAQKVPGYFFATYIVTLSLYVLLILNESDLVEAVDLWEGVYLWTKFAAYLGTAFYLLKAADLLLVEDYLIAKKGVHIPQLVRLLLVLSGLAASALLFLRTVMGINVVALVAIPTAATAVIGFALQDTLKRFFAGLMLGKLIRVGDWVCVAGKEGRVVKVDLGHVTILTRDEDQVTIPNNIVVQQDILNYSKPTTKHGRTALVEAGYAAPPMQVQAVLIEAARAVPGVLQEPSPEAFVVAFKDSAVQYRLKFWIKDYVNMLDIEGQVLAYVWYAFQRHGIEIPYPQRTVHMMPAPDETSLQASRRERILNALRRIEFLSVLSPENLETVARESQIQVYLPGEIVVRQGDVGREFFFILEGDADVRRGEGQATATVAALNPVQLFGEMALLTGEPRSATIAARTRLEVLVISKEVLARPIMDNPVLAERIGGILAERKAEMASQQERASHRGEPAPDLAEQSKTFGSRIRKFFGTAAR
ncbi:MAG: mechanosensitive ion channel [Nitrospirae bacterium]|nr:MAG: mechanosensitive ion channel [Nitrospirota bacterium]